MKSLTENFITVQLAITLPIPKFTKKIFLLLRNDEKF